MKTSCGITTLRGKWCPRPWMGDDTNTYYGTSGNEQWKKFKERLSGEELDMNIEEARKQLTSCADTGDTPPHGRATRRNSASERAFSTATARAIMGGSSPLRAKPSRRFFTTLLKARVCLTLSRTKNNLSGRGFDSPPALFVFVTPVCGTRS